MEKATLMIGGSTNLWHPVENTRGQECGHIGSGAFITEEHEVAIVVVRCNLSSDKSEVLAPMRDVA